MRSLAAEGRTVLVSSHLMPEMEHTADHLIVIGRGQLHRRLQHGRLRRPRLRSRRSWSGRRSGTRWRTRRRGGGRHRQPRLARTCPFAASPRNRSPNSRSRTASACTTWRRRRRRWNRRSWNSPPTAWNTTRAATQPASIRNGGRTMTAVTTQQVRPGARTTRGRAGLAGRAPLGVHQDPRRSGPPTGRWRCWCWPAWRGASLLVPERRRTGRHGAGPDWIRPDEQHHRADPARAAGHRRTRRAGDHLRVLDPGDPRLADGDAAARDPVRGQGRCASPLSRPSVDGSWPSFASFFTGQRLLAGVHAGARCRSRACCGRSWSAALFVVLCGLFSYGLGAVHPQHRRDHHHRLRIPAAAAAAGPGAAHALVRRRDPVAARRAVRRRDHQQRAAADQPVHVLGRGASWRCSAATRSSR